jgi:hypothetical protein
MKLFVDLAAEYRLDARNVNGQRLETDTLVDAEYVIEIGSQMFLYQHQQLLNEVRKLIVDTNDKSYSEDQILNKLGIPPMGLTLDDIVDTFVEEGEE